VFLKKREPFKKTLSQRWLTKFLHRHNELKCTKPQKLAMARAKACSKQIIDKYFDMLKSILDKYSLNDKPERVFNIDETGFSPEHSPSKIIGSKHDTLQAIVSPRSATTTVISAASASGQVLPPFFIFKGKRHNSNLFSEIIPGSKFTMSDSGWSTSIIFQDYLKNHFLRHVPSGESKYLVLYDILYFYSQKPCE
jgi:hypothetical protein